MRLQILRIRRCEAGLAATEFAILAPVLLLLIVGIVEVGRFYLAHATLRNAVAEGSRHATIYPRPSSAQIIDRVKAKRGDLDPTRFTEPNVIFQTSAAGVPQAVVSMSYTEQLRFLFFDVAPVTLSYSRTAHVHAPES